MRATCALTARTPNPASPAAASAARRSGLPALGRGLLLLACCLDVRSHPLSAQSPKARVVHRGFSQGSHRGRPSGGPTFAGFLAGCFGMGWGRGARMELDPDPGSVSPGVFGCLLAEASRFATSASPSLGCSVRGWREARVLPRPTPSATLFSSCHSVLGFCFLPLRECQGAREARGAAHRPLSCASSRPPCCPSLSILAFSIGSPRIPLPA